MDTKLCLRYEQFRDSIHKTEVRLLLYNAQCNFMRMVGGLK